MKKPKKTLHKPYQAKGPLGRKVLANARLELQKKVINLNDWKEAKLKATEFQDSVVSSADLEKYDPLHALYIYAQNQLSVLIEILLELRVLHKLSGKYSDAHDSYLPSAPPMSPLTASYFTSWGAFDLCSGGVKKETLCSIAIDFCKFSNVDEQLINTYENMQNSRMGIYVHEGHSDGFVNLRELITNRKYKVFSCSGYIGNKGELWLSRIFPPLFNSFNYSLSFTTPYLLGKLGPMNSYYLSTETDWTSYFERNLHKTGASTIAHSYHLLMKYGLSTNYWNEYIFLAYRNHKDDVIYLEGFPDIPSSLPHSQEGRIGLGLY